MEVGATAVFVSRNGDFAAGTQGQLSIFPPTDLKLPATN
jgi:hypothetical protein